MRKLLEYLALPAFTVLTSLFVSGPVAKADEYVVLTEDNAAELGIDFQKAKSLLAEAGVQVQDNVIGIKFHEESNQVDLSTLDSLGIVVNLDEVAAASDNGVIDGFAG